MKTNRTLATLLLTVLTLLGLPQPTPAQTGWGNALAFHGTDVVQIPNFGSVVPTNEVTVEAWVRVVTNANTWPVLFHLDPDQNTNHFAVVLGCGDPVYANLFWDFGNAWEQGRINYNTTLNVGTWQHFAFVASKSGNYMKVFRNGMEESSVASFRPFVRGSYTLELGLSFVGELEEFRIWNVARSQAEIAAELVHPVTGMEPNLVAYYRFDEGTGTTAHDATPNHWDGTLVNGPSWVDSGAPLLTGPADQTIDQGTSVTIPLPYREEAGGSLVITVVSENPVLLPNTPGSILVAGSGVNRTLTLTPVAEHSGAALIKVSAKSDASTESTTFTLNVRPRLQSPLLSITSAAPVLPNKLRLRFQDSGTGSTNYQVEFRGDLSPTNQWVTLTNVTPGVFQADVSPPPGTQGFFRVAGSRTLTASFDSSRTTVEEGAGTVTPVILFNGPFQGTVRYTLSGTLGTSDYTALSGVVQVNGTTAAIPITLKDNQTIDSLRYLTVRLESGAGYQLGATRESTLTVEENDADWQGQLQMPGGPLTNAIAQIVYTNGVTRTNVASIPLNNATAIGFILRIQRSGNAVTGTLTDPGSGFFPAQPAPVQLTMTPSSFFATANGLSLPADTTPFNVPIQLDLQLSALNGQPNQTNGPTEIAGKSTLATHYSGLPHLDTTNLGTFLLLKPPVKPSTNEVKLVTAP